MSIAAAGERSESGLGAETGKIGTFWLERNIMLTSGFAVESTEAGPESLKKRHEACPAKTGVSRELRSAYETVLHRKTRREENAE